MTSKHILAGSAIFYVVIAPFFFHPDLKIIYSLGGFLAQGVANIYAHYAAAPELFPLGPFVYPPAAYFMMGSLHLLVKTIAGPGFVHWLQMGNTAVEVEGIFRYLLAIKLPIIIVHVISGWILSRLVLAKDRNLALVGWFFNPLSIYVVALMGQIDTLAVIWIVLALYWATHKPAWGAIALGLGAAVKSFPLLLLPFFILLVAKSWRQRIVLSLAGLGGYGLWVVWFLNTPGFYEQTFASGLSKSILTPLPLVALAGAMVVAAFKHAGKVGKLNNYFLIAGLTILAGIHFHPQWIMWILPMAVIYVVQSRQWWWGGLLLVGWVSNVLSFADNFLTFGLLSPIEPSVFFLPAPIALMGNFVPIVDLIGKAAIIICLAKAAYDTVST